MMIGFVIWSIVALLFLGIGVFCSPVFLFVVVGAVFLIIGIMIAYISVENKNKKVTFG